MTHHKTQAAQDNIKAKLTLIEKWVKEGVPCLLNEKGFEQSRNGVPVFIEHPRSLDQFRRWGNYDLGIKSTNKEALNNYFNTPSAILVSELEDFLGRLASRVKAQKSETSKSNINALESEIKALKELDAKQNNTIAKYLFEIDSLNDDLKATRNRMNYAKEVARVENNELKVEVNHLHERLSRLSPSGVNDE
jgi:vacuolar-type H+-ATPase subunit I/STV1